MLLKLGKKTVENSDSFGTAPSITKAKTPCDCPLLPSPNESVKIKTEGFPPHFLSFSVK